VVSGGAILSDRFIRENGWGARQELEVISGFDNVHFTSFRRSLSISHREKKRLFAEILAGDHIARGFRNKDIRAVLFTDRH
jgi:hypothetical protein